jgi:hypothetical protein
MTSNAARFDDDELANAAGGRAAELLEEGGEAALAQLVPLIWAFGQQVGRAGAWLGLAGSGRLGCLQTIH